MNREVTYYSTQSTTHRILDFSVINDDFYKLNLSQWSWPSVIYKGTFYLILIVLIYLVMSILNSDVDASGLFFQVIIGILISVVLLPIHEGIHALVYRILGARDIQLDSNWKKFSFFVKADQFVLSRSEYIGLLLAPFGLITLVLVICMFFISQYLVLLGVIMLMHTSMCKGDFGLVSYVNKLNNELKKSQALDIKSDLLIYDDCRSNAMYVISEK